MKLTITAKFTDNSVKSAWLVRRKRTRKIGGPQGPIQPIGQPKQMTPVAGQNLTFETDVPQGQLDPGPGNKLLLRIEGHPTTTFTTAIVVVDVPPRKHPA